MRTFLDRRHTLAPGARAALAADLAGKLRSRVPGVRPGLHDEQFLEYLAAAKSGPQAPPVGGRLRLTVDYLRPLRSNETASMPPGRAGSLESLRRLNRLRVIRALRDEGQISRAEIARRTGLSRSTVSSLVADLQSDGLVVERAEPGHAHGAQGGRPPILLSFDASAGAAVGVDFGHTPPARRRVGPGGHHPGRAHPPAGHRPRRLRGPRHGHGARGRDARRRRRGARRP